MPIDRDDLRNILTNSNRIYKDIFKKRNVPFIDQYTTKRLTYPTSAHMQDVEITQYMWGVGDRYWKLASEFYGEPEYWWVIAWFNQKPTEAHVSVGDIILIPQPLEDTLTLLGI